MVSVYHGGPSGISAPRAQLLEGTMASDYFASSVGSAGDVNGDGYGDLVVGAPLADPGGDAGAGRAGMFHGGASGDSFGYSVASRGGARGSRRDDAHRRLGEGVRLGLRGQRARGGRGV